MSEEKNNAIVPATLLPALKVDLRISTVVYDERLIQYLQNAYDAISRMGITLAETPEDCMLVTQYAAWTFRSRDSGAGMPRMLQWALNNRLFSEKARREE